MTNLYNQFQDFFIRKSLDNHPDIFEKAKIKMLFQFSLFQLVLMVLQMYQMYVHSFVFGFWALMLGVITWPMLLVGFKRQWSVSVISFVFIVVFYIVSSIIIILSNYKGIVSGMAWQAFAIIFAFFTLSGLLRVISVLIALGVITLLCIDYFQLMEIPPLIPLWMTTEEKAVSVLFPVVLSIYMLWVNLRTRTIAQQQIQAQKAVLESQKEELEAQKEEIESQNDKLVNSINYSKRLQDSILPSKVHIDKLLPDHWIFYRPRDVVSGDFYWVEKKNDKVLFAVADCTGHGVPGALVSMVGNSALNRCIHEYDLTQPAAILDQLSELIEEAFNKGDQQMPDGMDISLCALDVETGVLEFSGAHNRLYLISEGVLTEVKADRQPIGKFSKKKSFTNHQLTLRKGDQLYLTTDGITDQFGGSQGRKFTYKRFKELLMESYLEDSNKQAKMVEERLVSWMGQESQLDDICVMNIRY